MNIRFKPILPLFLSTFLLATALQPTGIYDKGPIFFDDNAQLWYSIDLETRTASLALRINDSLTVSTSNWMGLGISEPSSGSMLGADIVTAIFKLSSDNDCDIVDRYVPFYAYPLGEATIDSPSAFPLPDTCQDDQNWVLNACQRDREGGEMVLEVYKLMDVSNGQDRAIVEGINAVIYAYGTTFGYHQANRGSVKVVMYEGNSVEEPVSVSNELPEDIDGFFDVIQTNYVVPSDSKTVYSCTSKKFEFQPGKKYQITAVEPILDSERDMVHHFTVFICSGEEYAADTNVTANCTPWREDFVNGPAGNPRAQCSTFLYAYAKGTGNLVLPPEAGFALTEDAPFIVIQAHLDNPDTIVGNVDRSGVRIHYTNKMREHDAGSIWVGDGILENVGVIESRRKYDHTCPSECTDKFSTSINVFGSFMHMHTTGREIYTNRFDRNGTFLSNINKVNFWSDAFQTYVLFNPPQIVNPGDQLHTTCVYDTSKRPETKFGLETVDEMCLNVLAYWPAQTHPDTGRRLNLCAFGGVRDVQTFTYCGDLGNISPDTVLPVPNPKFNDTIGSDTNFATSIDFCDLYSSLAPSPEDMLVEFTPQESLQLSPTLPIYLEEGLPVSTAEISPLPLILLTASPSDVDVDDNNSCFPASATVRLKDGATKRMDQVAIGDIVVVSEVEFSPVFMFTHKTSNTVHRFVQIKTAAGATISLTAGHFLYVNDELMMANYVKVGDHVWLSNGVKTAVIGVNRVLDRGLYNPQTTHGDIVVDGIRASTYTKSVAPEIAHGMLVPVRCAYLAGTFLLSWWH